jgi:DNA-binding Lrp family transcriptional regulator
MIQITIGSLEEQIIKLLQKMYPITIFEIASKLHMSQKEIEWVLQKFKVKGIVRLEPLPDKIYVRLVRNDFQFIGGKQQRKITKNESEEQEEEKKEEKNNIMYS